MDNTYNGAWGYDNELMIKALKWAYQTKKLEPSDYCSPKASGKPYETIAFHFLRLAYNPYCVEHGMEQNQLSFKHFGFKDAFLATIGIDPKLMKDDEEEVDVNDMSLSEEFGIEDQFATI